MERDTVKETSVRPLLVLHELVARLGVQVDLEDTGILVLGTTDSLALRIPKIELRLVGLVGLGRPAVQTEVLDAMRRSA